MATGKAIGQAHVYLCPECVSKPWLPARPDASQHLWLDFVARASPMPIPKVPGRTRGRQQTPTCVAGVRGACLLQSGHLESRMSAQSSAKQLIEVHANVGQ